MPSEILVPPLGESVVEATVGKWLKKEGEFVTAGEPVVELETEKINLEVSADAPGILERIERQTGETVHPGDVLAIVAERTDGGGQAPRPAEERPAPRAGAPPEPHQQAKDIAETRPGVSATVAGEYEVTPVARRLAEDLGVNISKVQGTGPGGRITKEDVLAYAAQRPGATLAPGPSPLGRGESAEQHPAPPTPPEHPAVSPPTAPPTPTERPATPPPPAPAPTAPSAAAPPPAAIPPLAPAVDRREERVRMTRRRQTIARRLVEAQQTAAMLTTFNEIDMSAVIELRKRRREEFRKRHDVDLGYMSFFTKATIGALKAFPELNAEIQGDEIVYKRYYDIGIAIGAEGGLVVPVLRNADQMTFAQIERQINDFVQRARDGTLTLEDLRGGTFTITNGGVFGSLLSTPILNPPQVGILGMHKIEERPIALGGQVVIHPMMYVALTYDHRIVDGREAVQFLVRVKELIEDPERLLLEG